QSGVSERDVSSDDKYSAEGEGKQHDDAVDDGVAEGDQGVHCPVGDAEDRDLVELCRVHGGLDQKVKDRQARQQEEGEVWQAHAADRQGAEPPYGRLAASNDARVQLALLPMGKERGGPAWASSSV